MTGLEVYLLLVLPLHAMDEAYHCNNIPLVGNDKDLHLVCNWAEDDYEYYTTEEGKLGYQLKRDCKDDNRYEKRARDKHWKNKETKDADILTTQKL